MMPLGSHIQITDGCKSEGARLTETKRRKLSHIRTCLEYNVQARNKSSGFEDVHLVHNSLPEMALDDVDVSTRFFGKKLSAPIVIEAMTGGTEEAAFINAQLARAAESLGVALGVGSQRAAIENPALAYTYEVVREEAPSAFILANLGVSQLVEGYGVREAQMAVDMVDADALAVHLNPLQEAIQPEGDRVFTGALSKMSELTAQMSVPVVAKETGAGITSEVALRLEDAGFDGIDVAGAGGTSWAGVEALRARDSADSYYARLGEVFWDWGISTVASVVEVRNSTELTLIASGGVRSGIDIAKALVLGADVVGLAYPLLKPATEGADRVIGLLEELIGQLKTAMFLTGSRDLFELRERPAVITGETREWLIARGFDPDQYGRRLL